MVPSGADAPGRAIAESVYPRRARFIPDVFDQVRVAQRLGRLNDGIDIDHYVFTPNRRTSTIGLGAKQVRRRPIIHTVPSRPIERAPLFADIHVTFSRDTAKILRSWGAKDVRVIPPAVQVPPNVHADRARFGIPTDKRAILFAGDMIEPGGAETLGAALERMRDVIGVFAYRDKGGQVQEMVERVTSRIGDRAIMLGVVDDLFVLMKSVDLNCLAASDLTGKVDFPYVILESMALGTPVAVGDMSPLNELGSESDGVLRVSYSPRQLSRQLERLLKDETRLAELAERGKKAARERFSLTALGAAYSALYDELG